MCNAKAPLTCVKYSSNIKFFIVTLRIKSWFLQIFFVNNFLINNERLLKLVGDLRVMILTTYVKVELTVVRSVLNIYSCLTLKDKIISDLKIVLNDTSYNNNKILGVWFSFENFFSQKLIYFNKIMNEYLNQNIFFRFV